MEVECEVLIPLSAVGFVVGKMGSKIRRIMSKSSSTIKIKESTSSNLHKVAFIRGLPENVEIAKELLLKSISEKESLSASQVTKKVEVPAKSKSGEKGWLENMMKKVDQKEGDLTEKRMLPEQNLPESSSSTVFQKSRPKPGKKGCLVALADSMETPSTQEMVFTSSQQSDRSREGMSEKERVSASQVTKKLEVPAKPKPGKKGWLENRMKKVDQKEGDLPEGRMLPEQNLPESSSSTVLQKSRPKPGEKGCLVALAYSMETPSTQEMVFTSSQQYDRSRKGMSEKESLSASQVTKKVEVPAKPKSGEKGWLENMMKKVDQKEGDLPEERMLPEQNLPESSSSTVFQKSTPKPGEKGWLVALADSMETPSTQEMVFTSTQQCDRSSEGMSGGSSQQLGSQEVQRPKPGETMQEEGMTSQQSRDMLFGQSTSQEVQRPKPDQGEEKEGLDGLEVSHLPGIMKRRRKKYEDSGNVLKKVHFDNEAVKQDGKQRYNSGDLRLKLNKYLTSDRIKRKIQQAEEKNGGKEERRVQDEQESGPVISFNWKVPSLSLSNLFDTHCHIDFLIKKSKNPRIENYSELVQEYPALQHEHLEGFISNFCKPSTWPELGTAPPAMLASDLVSVHYTVGCHPHFAEQLLKKGAIEALERLLVEGRGRGCVAVGECGLDASKKNRVDMVNQREAFKLQVELAMKLELPLVLHIRDAEEEGIAVLKSCGLPGSWPVHRHCWNDSWDRCKEWLDLYPGSVVGLTGLVTYRQAEQAREVARMLPLDRLVLETDAPYFRPEYSGLLPPDALNFSHPAQVLEIAAKVANIKGVSLEVVSSKCRQNVKRVYSV